MLFWPNLVREPMGPVWSNRKDDFDEVGVMVALLSTTRMLLTITLAEVAAVATDAEEVVLCLEAGAVEAIEPV